MGQMNEQQGLATALIYTRVSTSQQELNYSLATQRAACRAYAQQHGMRVVDELSDSVSGATLDRPGLNAVREQLHAGKAQALIVYCPDRLTREVVDGLIFRKELRQWGVTLHLVTRGAQGDSAADELLATVENVIAAYERRTIHERMQRGRQGKIASGRIVGNGVAPFGYRYLGGGKERVLVIDEHEARIVLLIYTWYARELWSVDRIVAHLTELQIPTANDRRAGRVKRRGYAQWEHSTVYKILSESTYMGIFQHDRYTVAPHEGQQKGRMIRRPKADWQPIALPEIAIVDEALWRAAQDRRATGRARSQRNAKHQYLLTSHLVCACGYAMHGLTRTTSPELTYYRCNARAGKKLRSCDAPIYRADAVEQVVWGWIETQILDERELEQVLATQQARANEEARSLENRRAVLLEQRRALAEQQDRLIKLYLSGRYDEGVLEQNNAELAAVARELDREIGQLESQLHHPGLTDAEVLTLKRFAQAMRDELRDLDFQERRWVLDRLGVTVRLVTEEEGPVAYVTCVLTVEAAHLPLATQHRRRCADSADHGEGLRECAPDGCADACCAAAAAAMGEDDSEDGTVSTCDKDCPASPWLGWATRPCRRAASGCAQRSRIRACTSP